MLFKSPHPDLALPGEKVILPHFLLKPTTFRTGQPLLYPVAKGSPFSSNRPNASVLSLDNVREVAYKTAKSIIDGALDGQSTKFKKGDVVAINSANQHDYLALVLGIHLVGGVVALCNPSYKEQELAHQLRMTKTRCILTTIGSTDGKPQDNPLVKAKAAIELACNERDDGSNNGGGGGFDKLSEKPILYVFEEDHELSWSNVYQGVKWTEEIKAEIDQASLQINGHDAAVFCFSSGTSGLPKAVTLTHSNLIANTIQATFLLYDRINEPLVDGKEFSKSGNVGWYDKASKGMTGPETKEAQNGNKTTLPKSKSLLKTLKSSSSSLSFKHKNSKEEQSTNGNEGNQDRLNGQKEFHIDVLPQFHCYGLLVNLVALHTVS